MKFLSTILGGLCLICAFQASAVTLAQGDSRAVSEPSLPSICKTLDATLQANARQFDDVTELAPPDTARIQQALSACASAGGGSVLLRAGSGDAFLTGPLSIAGGVVLAIDSHVTLYASHNPGDYQSSDRGQYCGQAGKSSGGCVALLNIKGNNTGVMGIRDGSGHQGTLDGRGDLPMKGNQASWWRNAEKAKDAGNIQNNPDLIKVQNSQNFTLYHVNLINAPYFHFFAHIVNGLTIWGVRVASPANSPNTDGLDLDSVLNATVYDSDVMAGDDGVAIKTIASKSGNITVRNSRFYGTHGLSIGSEVMYGVDNVLFQGNTLVGNDANGNRSTDNNGLRIKTSLRKGGTVSNVSYVAICMYGVTAPLVINPFYDHGNGGKTPQFQSIVVDGLKAVGTGAGGGGKGNLLAGYDATAPLDLILANVALDTNRVQASDAWIGLSNSSLHPAGTNVVTASVSYPGTVPDCSGAPSFPPLSRSR